MTIDCRGNIGPPLLQSILFIKYLNTHFNRILKKGRSYVSSARGRHWDGGHQYSVFSCCHFTLWKFHLFCKNLFFFGKKILYFAKVWRISLLDDRMLMAFVSNPNIGRLVLLVGNFLYLKKVYFCSFSKFDFFEIWLFFQNLFFSKFDFFFKKKLFDYWTFFSNFDFFQILTFSKCWLFQNVTFYFLKI